MCVCVCVCFPSTVLVIKTKQNLTSNHKSPTSAHWSNNQYVLNLCVLYNPRTLRKAALKYCAAMICVYMLSHVWLFLTAGTVASQAPLSMKLAMQEYQSGLPLPTPRGFSWSRDQSHSSWVSWTGRWILYPCAPARSCTVNLSIIPQLTHLCNVLGCSQPYLRQKQGTPLCRQIYWVIINNDIIS